jgi:adenylate cyclase
VIPPSRQAAGVIFPFATATSTCRSRLTICSGVCFFPRAIPGSSHTSFSDDYRWYKIRRALTRSRGQLDESISLQKQVIALDPLKGGPYGSLGIRLFAAGKLDEALAAHQRALELDPQLEYIHLNRAEILLEKGLPAEALKEVDAEPGEVWRLLGKAIVLRDLGQSKESDAALQQLIATHSAEPYNIASAYACRREPDQVFIWLDRAFELRDVSLIGIRTDPLFRKLHSDPRFAAHIHQMKILP